MKTPTRLTIGIGLAGCAALLVIALRTDRPPSLAVEQKRSPVTPSPVPHPLAADSRLQEQPADEEPLLPPPVLAAPAVNASQPPRSVVRPTEESMIISWAARDPEGAGRWLNQNRNHPKFADMVRGYAIQIATIDPAAARQWASVLNGTGNRFALGGTLEDHIDAIEAMLKGPDATQTRQLHPTAAGFFPADYTPVLVRQNPGEPPVLEMQPTSPT